MPRLSAPYRLGIHPESATLSPFVTMNSEPANSRSLLRIVLWAVLAVTVASAVFARVRLLDLPLERDEGEYAYTGQLMLSGVAPYKLAYSMKFPGTSAVYGLLMLVFGQTPAGVHLGLVLINLITVGLLFILGRELLGSIGGIASAAAYSVLSLMPHVLGNAAHATHFVVLFAVAGALLLLRAVHRRSCGLLFSSGCVFGMALLMKQPGFFFVVFSAIYVFLSDRRAGLKGRDILFRNLMLLAGAALPFGITCLFLWMAGVFQHFWFWTITYAGRYGQQVSLTEGVHLFSGHFFAALGTAWPIWLFAAAGFVICLANHKLRPRAGFLVTFGIFSALAVCPGLYFRPHYFILLLPVISLFAASAVVAACQIPDRNFHTLSWAAVVLFALSLIWPLWCEADFFFERPIAEANRLVNGTNPFPESIKIGEYIRSQTTPTDTIAVLGSEPQIYFYAQRRSATGYIYTYGLMEPQPYAHQMQEEMIQEIETANPKFLVLVVISKSWLATPESDQSIFRWADRFCDANYEEVALINISDSGTDYYFSDKPHDVTPTADHILIYRRKT